jgi:hypothetical protein
MPSKDPCEVTCTLFNGVRPNVREVWHGSWDEFATDYLPLLVAERVPAPADDSEAARQKAKKRCTGFVLAEVTDRRTDANVGAHTALAIDVDVIPDGGLDALLERAARYRSVTYETPSSTPEAPRVRVVVALAEPIAPEDVPAARRALAERLGLDPDACGTAGALPASQVMFAGRMRGTPARETWASHGKVWKPPAPTERTRPRDSNHRTLPHEPSRAAQSRAGVLRRPPADAFDFDTPPDLSPLARYLAPVGVPDDRHGLVRAVGGWLARKGYSPEAIRDAVAGLCAGTCADPTERAAQAHDAATRARAGLEAPGWEYLSGRFPAAALRRLERKCRDPREPDGFSDVWSEWWVDVLPRIEATFATRRAHAAVTAPPLDDVAPGAEQDGTGLHLHPVTGWPWILQRDGSYWIHQTHSLTYRTEVRSSELEASVARNLAGLVSEDDRTPTGLRSEWIKPLERLRATYTIRTHTYDPPTNTLTLAALRWTTRTAHRHAHIDRWLRALFGKGYDAAAQWIAALSALSRPSPCLYLPGPRGLGKSLLADGLAALWSRPAPVDMGEAIDSFNELTGECPLVFTDEGFPEGLDFNAFRKMVTQHSRRVNVKYRAKVDVEGCARFMICANNEDVLRYQKVGTLTKDDLEAIGDRLLVIPCHVEARAVVDSHSAEEITAWAQGDIAEHALWLAEQIELEPAGRMAAKPGGGERILASVVAGRSVEILGRIREALGTGNLGERMGVKVPKKAPASASEIWINVPALCASFDGRVALAAVKECCDSFALRPGCEQHKTDTGENLRWRVLSRVRLDEAFATLD